MKFGIRAVILCLLFLCLCLMSCGTRNTRVNRVVYGFFSRYNHYHNALLLYDKARILPMDIGASRDTLLHQTIKKCERAIHLYSLRGAAKECNPFLWHVWLLQGKAYLQQGEIIKASETFARVADLYSYNKEAVTAANYWQKRWLYDETIRCAITLPDSMAQSLSLTSFFTHQLRATSYRLLFVYRPEVIDRKDLLYAVVRANFSCFTERVFDVSDCLSGNRQLLSVKSFASLPDAQRYGEVLAKELASTKLFGEEVLLLPISEENYRIVLTDKRIDEYINFFRAILFLFYYG